MSRIRTVKPEICAHEGLFDLEVETGLPIRFAWVGLFMQCDREGRFRWRPRRLKAAILPYDNVDFSRVLDALATRGFLQKYEVDGEEYGVIPTWKRHQMINGNERDSELPVPPERSDISIESPDLEHVDNARPSRESRDNAASETRLSLSPSDSPSSSSSPSPKKKKRQDHSEDIRAVLDYYGTLHPRANVALTSESKEWKLIKCRLVEDFSVEDLRAAIDGNHLSPFHCGENPERAKHHGLQLIFRDASQVNKFVEVARNPPTTDSGGSTRGSLTDHNMAVVARFAGGLDNDRN